MRAYIASISHETNAFSPIATTRRSFKTGTIGYSDLLLAAREYGCEVIAGPSWRAAPSAPTNRADYESLRDELIEQIAGQEKLDIILLNLHGAQVADGYPDCESDIVQRVRNQVGRNVVIGVLLDLHAAVSTALLEAADLVTVIKEYPHTDFPDTARQLVDLALRQQRREISPRKAFVPVPLFSLWHTPDQPMKALLQHVREIEQSGEVLHVSLIHGFPWSDVAAAGAAVLVITDDDPAKACSYATQFANQLWAIRDADMSRYVDLQRTINRLRERPTGANGPLVVADAADNPGAGCGGDATWLIHGLAGLTRHRVAVALLFDHESLARIITAGEGNRVELALGGHTGSLAGEPLRASFEILCIHKQACIDAMPGYPPLKVGTLARVRCGQLEVVVGNYREQVFGPRVFTEVGIDPTAYDVLVVKSAQHFYQQFADIAAEILYCDTPCSRTIEFSSLPFRNRRKPIWPLEACTQMDIPKPLKFPAA